MTFRFFSRAAAGVALAVALGVWVSTPAHAQQPAPATVAAAKELLQTRGSLTMFEPIVPGVIEQAKNVLLQANLNLSKELNDTAAQLRKDLAPKTDELKEEVAKVFAERFTEQEIKDLTTFFKSPLGKKLLVEEPNFVERSLGKAQDWANALSEQVLVKFREEMKKKGHTL